MISSRPATALVAVCLFAASIACTACGDTSIAAPVAATSSQDRAAALEVEIQVSPASIEMDSEGTWITVHATIRYSLVDRATLSMNGVTPSAVKSDACGDLVVKFSRTDIFDIVSPPEATLTLSGLTTAGESFSGTVVVPVR